MHFFFFSYFAKSSEVRGDYYLGGSSKNRFYTELEAVFMNRKLTQEKFKRYLTFDENKAFQIVSR